MLINNLESIQDLFDAFDELADNIDNLQDAVSFFLAEESSLRDEGKSTLSNEQFERLEELQSVLDNLTAYV